MSENTNPVVNSNSTSNSTPNLSPGALIDDPVLQNRSKTREFFKKFMQRKTAVVAGCFILLLIVIAFIGPAIAPFDPAAADYNNMGTGPSATHLMGTDEFGRDVFSRLLAGTRLSLGAALSAVLVGAALGTILGILAGYYGGFIEALVMRSSDVLFAMPDILLCIAVVAIIGPGLINVVIAVTVFTIPSFARIMRSATLSVKGSLYVEVAHSIGCKDGRILSRYIFPGTVQSMIVNFTMRIGSAILAASSLSFLGFGADATQPEWGVMLSTGRNYIGVADHLILFPGLLIFLTVLAFNLFGDGLRDTLDPKIK